LEENDNCPTMVKDLSWITGWAHRLIGEVLKFGETAVDLTAGNGHDALFLFQCVGQDGRVVAFDIQDAALEATAHRIERAGGRVFRHEKDAAPEAMGKPAVHLIAACHSQIDRFLPGRVAAVIANLGYLPGGGVRLPVTRRETTVEAIGKALELIEPGGRLAVVAYVGHTGGREEAAGVEALVSNLPPLEWSTIRVAPVNRPGAPFLLSAEKRTLL